MNYETCYPNSKELSLIGHGLQNLLCITLPTPIPKDHQDVASESSPHVSARCVRTAYKICMQISVSWTLHALIQWNNNAMLTVN